MERAMGLDSGAALRFLFVTFTAFLPGGAMAARLPDTCADGTGRV